MNDGPVLRYSSDREPEVVPPRPRNRSELLREAALAVPHLVLLLGRLMRDPAVPRGRKVLAGVAAAYVAAPVDLLPDVIPFIGRIDDVVVMAAAIHYLMRGVPEEKLAVYWDGSRDALDIVAGLIEWGADLLPGPLRRLVETGP